MGKRAVSCLAFLVAGILAIGCGGSDGTSVQAGATVAASPTTPLATLTPTAEPPTPEPTPTATRTAAPTALPTATQVVPPADPDCAKRANNHLNIDKLRDESSLADAVITERDEDSILIDLRGTEVIVRGWGNLVGIRGDLTNDELALVSAAIDSVRYVC